MDRHAADCLDCSISNYEEVEKDKPLQPIPSVIDLKDLGSSRTDAAMVKPVDGVDLNRLHVAGTASRKPNDSVGSGKESRRTAKGTPRAKEVHPIRYDVDVLTKICVYAGIGWIAT